MYHCKWLHRRRSQPYKRIGILQVCFDKWLQVSWDYSCATKNSCIRLCLQMKKIFIIFNQAQIQQITAKLPWQ